MDDKGIVALYLARDQRAIDETALRYSNYCFTVANNVLENRQDAEECVNDTYIGAWNSIPPNKPQNLRAYLGKIARNIALKRWRARNAAKRGGNVSTALEELAYCLPDGEGDPAQSLELTELAALIDRFVATLKTEERQIFVGRYWYFYSVKQIAAMLGLGKSAVKVSLMRSRSKLKSALEKEGYCI